jgi:aldose 1-epimerase
VGSHERRRKAVAVEPMTCPPDAFRTGVALIELDPGATWQGRWGLRPETSTPV